jgi:phage terminase small subunit
VANSAGVHGHRLLTDDKVGARIRELQKAKEEKLEITQDRVLKELAILAFSDIEHYTVIDDDTGAIQAKGFKDMPEGASRALQSVDEHRTIKESADGKESNILYQKTNFHLHDKNKALDMLGKHLGMFKERVEHSGSIKTNDRLVVRVIHTRPGDKGNGGNGDGEEKKA